MKRKKWWILALAVVVIVVATAWVVPSVIKRQKYETANRLLSAGAYAQASLHLAELGAYEDSLSLLHYALMLDDVQNARYALAAEKGANIAGFRDANAYTAYASGMLSLQEENYEDAVSFLQEADLVKDAPKMLANAVAKDNETKYANAQALAEDGDWLAAHGLYERIEPYLDSAEQAAACYERWQSEEYARALSLLKEGSPEAGPVFSAIGDYLDSAQLADAISDGEMGMQYALLKVFPIDSPHAQAEELAKLGSYRDAADLVAQYTQEANEQDYQRAHVLMNREVWDQAMVMLQGIPDYKDTPMLLLLCQIEKKDDQYEQAALLRDEGNYEQALALFQSLESHLDSPAQAILCKAKLDEITYNKALELYAQGNAEAARALFASLGEYEQSAYYLEKLQ